MWREFSVTRSRREHYAPRQSSTLYVARVLEKLAWYLFAKSKQITVPAVWSDTAQAKTRACADAAGMGVGASLHIISEPEAAALYALKALNTHGLKIGDTFMLCDAGGGTVDLITYKVSSLKPVLKLTEVSPGSGSLCGASYLDRGFQEYLNEKLGNESGYDDEVLEEVILPTVAFEDKQLTIRKASKRFEAVVKRQFRGTSGEEFHIPGTQALCFGVFMGD